MFKLAGAAIGQKLRGLLNPVIGEKIWVVNREAVFAKASERWKAMSLKERTDQDFDRFGDSVLGRIGVGQSLHIVHRSCERVVGVARAPNKCIMRASAKWLNADAGRPHGVLFRRTI